MSRRWLTLLSAFVVAASVSALASCEQGTTPQTEAPPFSASVAPASSPELIRERLEAQDVLSLTHLIGLDGGFVRLAGHALEIPAGAVLQPTLFTLRVVSNGYVEVEATALASGLLGRVINIGTSGFQKPVKLHLTYARATNVPTDRSRLIVLRKVGGYDNVTNYQRVPSTVDTQRQVVTAELMNFSGYMMAAD